MPLLILGHQMLTNLEGEVSQWHNHCFLYMQSDREKSEGLPVAPFMDRDKVSKPTAQIGFIKFVLIPLFELLNKVLIAIRTAFLALPRNLFCYK